jgi:hypothetical protein
MARDGSFARYREALLGPCNNGPEGRGYARGLGNVCDAQVDLLRLAALCRLPTRCPDDALDHVGAWLQIPRFPGEPDGTLTTGYRGRLCAAWATWKKAGSAQAIIDSLHAYGFVDVEVFTTCEQVNDDGTIVPAWPEHDGYSDFWVLLGPDFGTIAPPETQTWGEFTWGGQTVWSSTAALSLFQAVRGQVLKWKAAHAHPVRVIFYVDGFVWGPSLWGEGTWGGHAFGLGF